MRSRWQRLNQQIVRCERCPRLRTHCRHVATTKRRAYANDAYWGRPVANFGNAPAKLLIVGLAPAAHGANRTGRMFTGDRSGDWLYRALYRGGFASQPTATDRHDGLQLTQCAITAVCHCAPPGNRPTAEEKKNCRPWLTETLDLVRPRVYLALGKIAWDALWVELRVRYQLAGPRPKFAHAARIALPDRRLWVGSYHPSQQNTFTGRLTESMFDDVIRTVSNAL